MSGTNKQHKKNASLVVSPSQHTSTSLKPRLSRGEKSSLNKEQSTNDYDPSTAGVNYLYPSTTNFTNMLKRPTTTQGIRRQYLKGVTFENEQDALTMAISSQMTTTSPQGYVGLGYTPTQLQIASGMHTV